MAKAKWTKEFIEFIDSKNVLNLAVGVVLGTAFGQIVNSLVNNIIMPVVGIFLGGVNISGLSFTVKNAHVGYGMFLQNILNFLIIAFCIFWFVRAINRMGKALHPHTEHDKQD